MFSFRLPVPVLLALGLSIIVIQYDGCTALEIGETAGAKELLPVEHALTTLDPSSVFVNIRDQQGLEGNLVPKIRPQLLSIPGQRLSSLVVAKSMKLLSTLEAAISRRIASVERTRRLTLSGSKLENNVRHVLSKTQWQFWDRFAAAMRLLVEREKCGPVYSAKTGKYSICCVFKVGQFDSEPYSYVSRSVVPSVCMTRTCLPNRLDLSFLRLV